jgi:hypothetical protein
MSIQPYEPAEAAVVTVQDQAVRRLTEWAQSAQAAHQIAQTLVQTTFVPASFKGKPGEATAAILAGLEVGLQPMAALRSFDVIQGQAAPRALTLRAIVQSFGHQMSLVESTATRCRMKGLRRGDTEWQTVTWTIDRAKDLGLTGKENWKKQPQAMLLARATSELARLIAADAILGIGYTVEEIADGGPVEQATVETVDATPTGTRRMSRKTAATTEAPADPAPEPEPTEGITQPQSKKLHAGFNDLGITDREQRLAYCTNLIGREVTSSNDLTKDEASRVIDALETDAAPEPELFEGDE